jgi:hypothetical protein
MARRNSISGNSLSFWAAGCLLLIIVGITMIFLRQDLHPTVLAFRLGLIAVGLVGLIVIAVMSRSSGPDPREIAREILAQQKSLYNAPHHFVPTSADEFDLDREFYDRTRQAFEAQGFHFLEDVENVTLSQALPAFRTFVRTMIGESNSVMARIYQMRPSGSAGRDIRTTELTTELSDFTFVCTTNAQLFLDATETRGILTNRCAADVSPAELLRRHRESVASVLAKNPGVTVATTPTLQDVLKSDRHAHAVRSVNRKRNGYVTEEDLKLVRGEPLTELDRQIFDEINKLEAKERSAENPNTAR